MTNSSSPYEAEVNLLHDEYRDWLYFREDFRLE